MKRFNKILVIIILILGFIFILNLCCKNCKCNSSCKCNSTYSCGGVKTNKCTCYKINIFNF